MPNQYSQTMQMMAPDTTLAQMQLARQQQMADLLRKQSLEGLGDTQVIGGWAVPKSPLEGLAKVFTAYGANKAQGDIDKKQLDLARQLREQGVTDMQGVMSAMQGTPYNPGIPAPSDDLGGGPGMPATPAVPGDRRKAMAIALQSSNPMVQQIGAKLMETEMKGPEGININGQMVDKYTGKPLGNAIPKQEEAYTLSPGAVRFDAQGKPIAAVNDFNKPFNPDGTPNTGFQQFEISKHKAGAPTTSIKIDNKMGEGLAKEVGPMVAASKAGAEGAIQQMDTASRINAAIDSGKLIAGPGANVRIKYNQIENVLGNMLGVGGATNEETLANTRAAVQGLAKFSLEGRSSLKGQGQISDYEGKLLAKATSGDISDLTLPELKVLTGTAQRVAKAQYEAHQRNMKTMRNKPELQGVADFYDVPQMPDQSAPNTASPQSPKAGMVQQGYRFKGGNPADKNNWEKL